MIRTCFRKRHKNVCVCVWGHFVKIFYCWCLIHDLQCWLYHSSFIQNHCFVKKKIISFRKLQRHTGWSGTERDALASVGLFFHSTSYKVKEFLLMMMVIHDIADHLPTHMTLLVCRTSVSNLRHSWLPKEGGHPVACPFAANLLWSKAELVR